MTTWPTRFDGLPDLARLPWFTLADGHLRLDPAVGPSIDVHTHLALTFLRPGNVDLTRETEVTQHYLPHDRTIDMDRYLNQSLTRDDRVRMEQDLKWGSFRKGGLRATHTAPNLRREMGQLGVVTSVLLAIDWPVGSDNSENWLRAVASAENPNLIVFGSVHPMAWNVAERLDALVKLGARGIKIHPAIQLLGPDHPKMIQLCQLCGERGLPVFFHCGPVGIEGVGARRRTQVDRYRHVVEACPDTTFVLGHAGALQPDGAIALAREFSRVWLEIASQGLPVVRRLLDEVDPTRICFGSDWPFYPQAIGLAKVLMATEDQPEVRRMLLHDNAARLLALS